MLEWFKAGFGVGMGLMAAGAVFLAALGLWDLIAIFIGKLRLALCYRKH